MLDIQVVGLAGPHGQQAAGIHMVGIGLHRVTPAAGDKVEQLVGGMRVHGEILGPGAFVPEMMDIQIFRKIFKKGWHAFSPFGLWLYPQYSRSNYFYNIRLYICYDDLFICIIYGLVCNLIVYRNMV